MKQRRHAGVLLLAIAATAACDDPIRPPTGMPHPPDVRAWVVGRAQANLDENGHFVLPEPTSPGLQPIVTRQMAGQIALGWVRTWIANPNVITLPGTGSIKAQLEEEHGRPIDWNSIQLENRVAYFAESPYEPLPDSVPIWVRRFHGPHYLVPLYVSGVQVVSFSLAAYSTDLWIDENGFVRLPRFSGNEFSSTGVPRHLPVGIPILPEEAVRLAAERTGAKVTEVPLLLQPGERWVPTGARWKLSLDREVEVDNLEAGERQRVRVLYVGVWGTRVEGQPTGLAVRWYVPRAEQPRSEQLHYTLPREHLDDPVEWRTVEVQFRADVPVLFDEVGPVGPL